MTKSEGTLVINIGSEQRSLGEKSTSREAVGGANAADRNPTKSEKKSGGGRGRLEDNRTQRFNQKSTQK